MRSPPLDPTERARLKLLSSLRLLETRFDPELDRLLRCLAAALGIARVAVMVEGYASLACVAGLDWPLADEVPRADPLYRQIVASGTAVTRVRGEAGFAQALPLLGAAAEPVTLFTGLPVHAAGGAIAALCVADPARRALDAREQALLDDFRILIERELELRADSTRDHLTGLLNRRYAEDFVDRETRRAFREQVPIAFVLLDLDYFKAYNDRYGHAVGDEALRQVAFAINGCCRRPADLVIRLGGEEFMIVLPATDLSGVERLIQRVQEAVAALELPHSGSPLGRLTFSAGAVVITDTTEPLSLVRVIEAADHHLYAAKQAGRNRYSF